MNTSITQRRCACASVLLLMAAIIGCTVGDPANTKLPLAPPVQWYVASSTTDAVQELRDRFVEETGIEVELTLASSSTLANQIMQGSGADLFLSASTAWGDEVARSSGEDVTRRCELLSNHLAIIVPTSVALESMQPQDLLAEEYAEVAIANPDSVPAGIYARQALKKLGLWESLQEKLIPATNVRAALQYVESGNIPVGIVYATDAAASPDVKVAHEFDSSLHDQVIYPLLQLKGRAVTDDTAKLFDYLVGDAAGKVFLRHGFAPLHLQDPANTSR